MTYSELECQLEGVRSVLQETKNSLFSPAHLKASWSATHKPRMVHTICCSLSCTISSPSFSRPALAAGLCRHGVTMVLTRVKYTPQPQYGSQILLLYDVILRHKCPGDSCQMPSLNNAFSTAVGPVACTLTTDNFFSSPPSSFLSFFVVIARSF